MVVTLSLGIVVYMLTFSKVIHWVVRIRYNKTGKLILFNVPEEPGDTWRSLQAQRLTYKWLQDSDAGIYIGGF